MKLGWGPVASESNDEVGSRGSRGKGESKNEGEDEIEDADESKEGDGKDASKGDRSDESASDNEGETEDDGDNEIVRVMEVRVGSEADRAGVRVGDAIAQVGYRQVRQGNDAQVIQKLLADMRKPLSVKLRYRTTVTRERGWETYEHDRTGDPYYFNAHSGETVWEKPPAVSAAEHAAAAATAALAAAAASAKTVVIAKRAADEAQEADAGVAATG